MPGSTFKILYWVGFAAAGLLRMKEARPSKQNRIAKDREPLLDRLLLFPPFLGMFVIPLVYVLTPWLAFADYSLPAWAGWLGAVIFVLGLWLLWRSHVDLGRNWMPVLKIREEHSLVTEGVYRYIRHPMYAAHLVWGIAQPLLLWNWISGFAMLVSLLPLFLYRVPREEQMLVGQFGDQYRSYMEHTGRIIPRL